MEEAICGVLTLAIGLTLCGATEMHIKLHGLNGTSDAVWTQSLFDVVVGAIRRLVWLPYHAFFNVSHTNIGGSATAPVKRRNSRDDHDDKAGND